MQLWKPFLLAVATHLASAYPSGAPLSTCMTMFPKHNGSQTLLEEGRFLIMVDSATYMPAGTLKVTISSPRHLPIKGVQVRAIKVGVDQEEIQGSFTSVSPSDKLKLLSCQGKLNNMVTHTNNEPVPLVEMTWKAPRPAVGPIIFEATVVESFSVFNVGLRSPVINSFGLALTSSVVTTQTNYINPVMARIDWGQCEQTKGCFLYPSYCSDDECKAGVTFSINETEGTAEIEMMVHEAGYVAMGFSLDRWMGDDHTISCSSVFDRVTIQNGYNNPAKFNVRQLRNNLTHMASSLKIDGRMYCRFTRPLIMEIQGEEGPITFDLTKQYYLFLAWGPTYFKSDTIGYHRESPVISYTKVDFMKNTIYRGSVMPSLIRAHSSMMCVAWMGFAGMAVILARYYKDGFNQKTVCGVRIWFHLHRFCALITFALTAAGLATVLVQLNGEITVNKSAHTHMSLGFAVLMLVCAQVLGGLIRPSPFSKVRPLFNFIHKLFGTSVLIVSAAAIIYAYKIDKYSYHMQRFGERTVGAWAIFHLFFEILLAAYKYLAPKTTGSLAVSAKKDSDISTKHKNISELETPEETTPSSYILLAIFILFTLCSITIAFCMTLFF